MFNNISGYIRHRTGQIDVRESKQLVIITGIQTRKISELIQKYWTTSKIAKFMFVTVSAYEIKIPSFFALEFLFILRTLQSTRQTAGYSRAISTTINGLMENTWIKDLQSPMKPWLNWKAMKEGIIFKPLPHQQAFYEKYEATKVKYGLRGIMLSAPPGAGKTAMDVTIALGTDSTKVIIICPKNANYKVWDKTLMQEMKVPQHPFIGERDPVLQPEKKWHIFHYEQLERAIELVSKWNVRQEKICIILDESHNFNDMKSLRTERFLTLCQMSESNDIIWASGTPVKALGTETIPLIKCIDPKFDARAEEAFKKMYGRDASRTLDILNHRLGIISFTVPKTQVMQDEPVVEQINIQMPNSDKYTLEFLSKVMKDFITERSAFYDKVRPEAIEYYRGIMTAFEHTLAPNETEAYRKYQECVRTLMTVSFDARQHGELAVYTNKYEKEVILARIPQVERNKFKDIKSVVKYPLLKVRGECLGRILTKERVQCHVDMLKYIDFEKLISNVEKKTIIFTSYVTVVETCANLLKSHKYKPLKVYGATNSELSKIVGVFEKDATANPLIATFQSLSTAVPLTMANGIIMLNANWRSYEREQAIARAHRIGQDRTVYVFDIILDTGDKVNISSRSLDIMKWSQEQVDAITGIKGDINITMESNELPVIVSGDVNDIVDDVCFSEDDLGDVERSVNTLVQQERISVSLPEQESSEPTDVALSSSFEKLFNKDGSRAD